MNADGDLEVILLGPADGLVEVRCLARDERLPGLYSPRPVTYKVAYELLKP